MNKIDWINEISSTPLIERKNQLKTIYFLYEFLGDDKNIESRDYIYNLMVYKQYNPDWNIEIIRDKTDQVLNYVMTKFPRFTQMYQSYPKDIQRCDIFRYMLLYKEGGVYSDLDVNPQMSINNMLNLTINNQDLSWANIIFGIGRVKDIEKCEKARLFETIREGENEIPYKVSNFFFIAKVKEHPIWMDILRLAKKRSSKNIVSQYGVIYTTGPDLVTTAISQNRKKYNDIAILPLEIMQKIVEHQCSSSWRTNNFRKCETFIDTT